MNKMTVGFEWKILNYCASNRIKSYTVNNFEMTNLQ